LDLDEMAAAIVLHETRWPHGWPSLREQIAEHRSPLALLLGGRDSAAARRRWRQRAVRREARDRSARLKARGGRLVHFGAPEFPGRLAALDWGPPWLFVRGAGRFPDLAVAIVGTRRATPSALEFARSLAGGAAEEGICVVSGLALGIDAAAHRGALDNGGATLAVLGTGVDRCYPAAHRRLFAEILADGLVVSELPPGAPPLKRHFPARNRILAGLCQAVLVAQAPRRSGALLTAKHGLDAGGEVLAVPGDPALAENAGSNRLLAAGARVALGIEDLVSAVYGYEVPVARGPDKQIQLPLGRSRPPSLRSASDRALFAEVDLVPREVDELARATGTPVAETLAGLLRLELAGFVEQTAGGRVRATPEGARARRGLVNG
jgi:DNA processing protein